MQVGMIGLGHMGSNMVRRLLKAGHECIVYNRSPEPVHALVGEGASGAPSLAEFVRMLQKPRAIWLMVPAGAVEAVLTELTALIDADDVLIDGGNSYYHDDIRRASWLGARGIHYLDVGTSGGVWGLERGSSFGGQVSDSGEGRWTIQAAVDEGIPVPVISAALFARFSSRGRSDFADKLLSAMRYEFGGHLEKKV